MKRVVVRTSLLVSGFSALAALSACNTAPADVQSDQTTAASQPPMVRTKSSPLVVREGSAAMFTVTVDGAEPMKYQWQRDGIDIPGALGRYHIVAAALRADNAARYSVRVSNEDGAVVLEVGELLVVDAREPMPWL